MRSPSAPTKQTSIGPTPVELGPNGVKIIGEQSGVDVESHGRRGVTEHLLDGLDVRAVGHGQAGGGVSQLGDDAREGYSLGDVPSQPPVADRRGQGEGQHPLGVADGGGREDFSGEIGTPTRYVGVG